MHTPLAITSPEAPLPEDSLDRALAACIVAPALPDAFRSNIVAAVLTGQLQSFAVRRQQLEVEHAQELLRLRKGHILLKRDTLVLVAACAFAAGACAQVALPWLHTHFDLDIAVFAPLLALLIGLAAGASVWADRFGKPGQLFGMLRFMA
jgi:hypothetical protein